MSSIAQRPHEFSLVPWTPRKLLRLPSRAFSCRELNSSKLRGKLRQRQPNRVFAQTFTFPPFRYIVGWDVARPGRGSRSYLTTCTQRSSCEPTNLVRRAVTGVATAARQLSRARATCRHARACKEREVVRTRCIYCRSQRGRQRRRAKLARYLRILI